MTKKVKSPFLFSQMHAKAGVSEKQQKAARSTIDESATQAIESNQALKEPAKVAMLTVLTSPKNAGDVLTAAGITDKTQLKSIAASLEADCNTAYQMKYDLVNNKEQEVSNTNTFRK